MLEERAPKRTNNRLFLCTFGFWSRHGIHSKTQHHSIPFHNVTTSSPGSDYVFWIPRLSIYLSINKGVGGRLNTTYFATLQSSRRSIFFSFKYFCDFTEHVLDNFVLLINFQKHPDPCILISKLKSNLRN